MEKLICPQCGGNDLKIFGNSAYKCESCGTILKDEPEPVAPISPPPPQVKSSSPTHFMTSEERYGNEDNSFDFSSDDPDERDTNRRIAGILTVIVFLVIGI